MCQNHLQGLLKHRLVGHALTASEIRSMVTQIMNFEFLTMFSGNANAASPGMNHSLLTVFL